MRYIVLCILLCICGLSVHARKKIPVADPRTEELAVLKSRLLLSRDSLQRDIAARWSARQKSLEKREVDKEELAELMEQQEQAFNRVLAIREEGYSLERRIESARKTLEEKKQGRIGIIAVLNETFEKEAQALEGMYPSDIDSTRLQLETIRKKFRKRNDFLNAIRDLSEYSVMTLDKGTRVVLIGKPILPDGEAVREMTVARFGTVFAYGKTAHGALYTISQTGRDGRDRYRIRRIDSEGLEEQLSAQFMTWAAAGRPVGSVLTDVMQSDLSGELIAEKNLTVRSRAVALFKAGGPVMIPLALLPLWALLLVVIKVWQFFGQRAKARKLFTAVVHGFDKDGKKGIAGALPKKGGASGKIVTACSDDKIVSRKGGESAAREVLFTETARLGRHLNTLAVIAGVAPLLGLLGTVMGMIRLFEVITRFGTGDPKLLAGGISEALVTTEVGLVIAVPVLLVHNFLRNHKNSIVAELQTGTLRVLNRLFPEG